MQKLKVFIADDHTLYRKAIVKLISDFKRIGEVKEASNGKELFDLCKYEIPDVAILDLEMPVLNGSKTCERLVQEFPEVKIIIVSMHDSKAQISYLLGIGAHAFLSKNVESEELESAIYRTVDKGFYRNTVMTDALRYKIAVHERPITNIKVKLSEKEHTIVKLICREFSNKQIGNELSLSENTVRNHKVRIMRKTGVKSTSGLIKYAFENGLVTYTSNS